MYSLFESIILHEAVPKKAKELGIEPEKPPDMNEPDPPKDDQKDDSDIPDAPSSDTEQGDSPPDDNIDNTETDPNTEEGSEDVPSDPNDQQQDLQPPDDLDSAEKEVFKDLKPEQIEIKKKELKQRYQDLYQVVTDTLEKLNKVTKTSYDANMIELCVKQLLKIKDMTHQIVIKVFPTRTYVENKIDLEKLATLFNSITNTIGIIYDSRVKRASLDNKNKIRSRDLNVDFHQDLGF